MRQTAIRLACTLVLSTLIASALAAPIPTDPAALQNTIRSACQSGQKKIVIPPGTYRLGPTSNRFYLRFLELNDFEIDATGVTLLRTDPNKGAIEFVRCRNVTLRGMTLLNETPPFTQGTITAIDPDGKFYDLRIDAGFPATFDDPRFFPAQPTGYIFDPATRQWKTGTTDMGVDRVERLGPDTFRLHWRGRARQPAMAGDFMAFRGRGSADIYVGDCAGMNIDGVTILSGGGFCIHEANGDGGNRYSYKVTYGPKPPGATSAPLIACNADAFHSSNVRKGPIVEGCSFEGMPDDGVPIHGSYATVIESAGNRLILANAGFFRVGDPIRLFDNQAGAAGEAKVLAIEPLRNYQLSFTPTRNERNKTLANFAQFTLDKPLPAHFEFMASDPNAVGSGYIVRNNTIRNHRARGMLLKADDGLVENNTIDGSTIAGIVIAPEYWWREACYSRNVIVRHNTIRHVGYATTGPWSAQAGAITITGAADKPAWPPGHQHIVLEDNTIADCDGVNLVIAAARDVLVKNNRFVNPQQEPNRRGADRGINPDALIWLSDCEDVRFEGNTIVNRGPAGKGIVDITPSARNVTGASQMR